MIAKEANGEVHGPGDLPGDPRVGHVPAGEEAVVHGEEGLDGDPHTLHRSYVRGTTFAVRVASSRPPGFTLSESVLVGRISWGAATWRWEGEE